MKFLKNQLSGFSHFENLALKCLMTVEKEKPDADDNGQSTLMLAFHIKARNSLFKQKQMIGFIQLLMQVKRKPMSKPHVSFASFPIMIRENGSQKTMNKQAMALTIVMSFRLFELSSSSISSTLRCFVCGCLITHDTIRASIIMMKRNRLVIPMILYCE
jgi:hypothetical protein